MGLGVVCAPDCVLYMSDVRLQRLASWLAGPLATSKVTCTVTSSAATNFPFIIGETRSMIIRQRRICAAMSHVLGSACKLLQACIRLRYGKEQNRTDLAFQAATTSF
jgi:hypothetical protein